MDLLIHPAFRGAAAAHAVATPRGPVYSHNTRVDEGFGEFTELILKHRVDLLPPHNNKALGGDAQLDSPLNSGDRGPEIAEIIAAVPVAVAIENFPPCARRQAALGRLNHISVSESRVVQASDNEQIFGERAPHKSNHPCRRQRVDDVDLSGSNHRMPTVSSRRSW
jgi:hypothetical protein